MSDTSHTTKQPVMLRIPHALAVEVRRIAAAEDESQSSVLRRLLKRGLEVERRDAPRGEAA